MTLNEEALRSSLVELLQLGQRKPQDKLDMSSRNIISPLGHKIYNIFEHGNKHSYVMEKNNNNKRREKVVGRWEYRLVQPL